MGYEGHLQVLPPGDDRDERVSAVANSLVDARILIEGERIAVVIVSTGGTGTYYVGDAFPGVTEIQAGSYLLMDRLYVNRGSRFLEFQNPGVRLEMGQKIELWMHYSEGTVNLHHRMYGMRKRRNGRRFPD